MTTLLNKQRPPVFCPGCAHERVTQALDQAFQHLGLTGDQLAIVSDIGCSGLFDTFFNTHAFHGLHGRALTYASGLKMACPELTVIVTMGDGGLGIGGAHVLSACRRNLDITLLVLNNFNYGMTGGQCSATTPPDAEVASGFLNRLEAPLDICSVAAAAGAPYTDRLSVYQKELSARIAQAIDYKGFALVDMWGLCPGRFTKRNRLTPNEIETRIAALPPAGGPVAVNQRAEYAAHYHELAAAQKAAPAPLTIEASVAAPFEGRRDILILGSAGQRIVTAGELLGLAGMAAGLHATLKSDYPITVLRGHSVSEVVLASRPVVYSGISSPHIVIALAPEGVARRQSMLSGLKKDAVILAVKDLPLPETKANVLRVDFKAQGVKGPDWALAALAVLAQHALTINPAMLESALENRFRGEVLQSALQLVRRPLMTS